MKILKLGLFFKPVIRIFVPMRILKRIRQRIEKQNGGAAGVNLAGFVKGQIGLGEGARLLAKAFVKSGIHFSVYNVEIPGAMSYGDSSLDDRISSALPYPISLVHVNPPEMEWLYEVSGAGFDKKEYTIGFWLWELEQLPAEWLKTFRLVNEIWTPSEYVSGVFRKYTLIPVRTVPYPISVQLNPGSDRAAFRLGQGTVLFLCIFDAQSTVERKNPIGAIRAYKRAFGMNANNVGLIVKINNPNNDVLNLIAEETSGLSNVTVIKEIFTKDKINALLNCCDVFVSLHRAEGFGLVAAEAMFLGKAVIVTNYSGVTEFATHKNCCLVDYTKVPVPDGTPHYSGLGCWAEPNIDQAAGFMVLLASDKNFRKKIGNSARRHIKKRYSVISAASSLSDNLTLAALNFKR